MANGTQTTESIGVEQFKQLADLTIRSQKILDQWHSSTLPQLPEGVGSRFGVSQAAAADVLGLIGDIAALAQAHTTLDKLRNDPAYQRTLDKLARHTDAETIRQLRTASNLTAVYGASFAISKAPLGLCFRIGQIHALSVGNRELAAQLAHVNSQFGTMMARGAAGVSAVISAIQLVEGILNEDYEKIVKSSATLGASALSLRFGGTLPMLLVAWYIFVYESAIKPLADAAADFRRQKRLNIVRSVIIHADLTAFYGGILGNIMAELTSPMAIIGNPAIQHTSDLERALDKLEHLTILHFSLMQKSWGMDPYLGSDDSLSSPSNNFDEWGDWELKTHLTNPEKPWDPYYYLGRVRKITGHLSTNLKARAPQLVERLAQVGLVDKENSKQLVKRLKRAWSFGILA